MIGKTWMVAAMVGALALSATRASAQQTVLSFEDFTPCDNGGGNVGMYGTVNFNHQFTCYSWAQSPYNASSGTNRVYVSGQNSGTFNFTTPSVFNGASFAGYDSVYFDMYLNGSLVSTSGPITLSGTPTFLSSGYNGQVDQVVVNGTNGQFVMDDVTFGAATITTTPEPGSLALLGTGLVGLVPMLRRKRR